MSAPTRKDWLLYGALGCALVGTAHAEYTLAIAAHFHPYVALAVPGALDLYVLRALQQRRDVFVAVLAMVAANVTAHLLTAGVLHEHWAITSAAGALAPLILWRVYSLKHTRNRQELLMGVEAGVVSTPEYAHAEWCGLSHPDGGLCSEYGYPPAPEYPTPYTYDAVTGQPTSWEPAPDRIPDWMDEEYPVSAPQVPASAPELPPLPPEYEPSASGYPVLTEEQWDELTASDREYLAELAEYIHSSDSHTLAGLRDALGIGQARATRLIKHARKEGTW